jgi:uncharacterized membrane protein
MEQSYRMVSTRGVVSGSPARSNGGAASGYVTQDAFNSFKTEIYLYISKVASFTREALVEMQRTMAGEQRDTDSLRNEERRNAEERRERRRELISGAMTRISSGVRSATGLGPLGALFTGLAASLTAVLANVDLDTIRDTFERIGTVFDSVREFFNKLQEYSNIILAIGAALAAMVAANMLDRTPKPSGGGRPSSGGRPSGGAPGTGAGGASSGAKPATGGPAGTSGTATAGAKPTTPPAPPAPAQPQVKPGYKATETPSGTRYRSEKTGRFVKPSEALTEPGAPTREPKPGQPTQDRPTGSKASRLRLGRFLGALGPVIEVFSARNQLQSLSEQRDNESIDEATYKREVINLLGATAGAIVGGLAGGALGSLLGPAGALLGGFVGSMGGAQLGEWLANTGVGQRVGELIYDRFFAERPTNQPEAQLTRELTELQRQSRERVSNTDEMTQMTDRAVDEGRITRGQARQLEEVGSQQGTNLRVGDIEQAINMMQFSGMEGVNYVPSRDQSGRIVVLPTIYQEVATPRSSQPATRPTPETPSEIQTRTPDRTFEGAAAAATPMGGQSRGGLIDRARARNSR